MILSDVCTLEYRDNRQFPDLPPHVVENVPCDISPITSAVVARAGAGSDWVSTDYLFVTTFDLHGYWREELGANPGYTTLWLRYRGDRLQVKAGFEIHRVMGRFHHIEAIVADFGRFSTAQ